MNNMKHKILSLLALLLTAVTGAMATTDPNSVYWDNQTWAGWEENVTTHTVDDITITCSGNAKVYESTDSGEPLALQAGANDAITFTSNGKPFASVKIQVDTNSDPGIAGWTWVGSEWTIEWSGTPSTSVTLNGCNIKVDMITFTFGTAEAPITVEPVTGKTNEWTFAMPGSDVVLTPQYAPTAKWVVEGEGDNAKTLLPTPAENIIAGTTDPIINEGTVATSTYGEGDGAKTIDQGTVMYAVTETNTTAPALTAYSDDVPTAAIVEGSVSEPTTRYVWYYIQGADTPAEEEATDKNTFNNSEVCATPLTVVLLPNVFNLVLKPTKANDITVEVNEVDKTLELIHNATENEDTLKAVKMQSDVKLKAKEGYKFRKVEVKKGGGEPVLLTTITAADNSSFKSGSQTFGDVATVTLTGDYLINDGSHGGWYCQGSNKTATISVAEANGANITSVKFYTAGGGSAEDKDAPFEVTTTTVTSSNITTYLNGNSIGSYGVSKIEVYGTKQ